jgi:hypothetical protein
MAGEGGSRGPLGWLRHDKAQGLLLVENSEASRQRLAHIHRILREKLVELNPGCAGRFDDLADAGGTLDFQSSDTETAADAGIRGVITSGDCRSAAALGFWRLWWPGKALHDTVLRTSVLSLAEIQGTGAAVGQQPLSSQITAIEGGEAEGTPGSLDVDRLSEDTIESASQIVTAAVVSDERKKVVAERWGKAPEAEHVFLHYDDRQRFDEVKTLAQKLSEEGYFVEKTIRHVSSADRACAVRSQVKYFHEEDRQSAGKLREAANVLVTRKNANGDPVMPPGWPIGAEEGLTDLSDWTLSAKVPRGQLELWWIAAGDRCEAARAGRADGDGAAG